MSKSLNKSQRLRLAEEAEYWRGVALSTDPADRPAAEKGITELYRHQGLGDPKFVWRDSPTEVMRAVAEWENSRRDVTWEKVTLPDLRHASYALRRMTPLPFPSGVMWSVQNTIWDRHPSDIVRVVWGHKFAMTKGLPVLIVRFERGQYAAATVAEHLFYRDVLKVPYIAAQDIPNSMVDAWATIAKSTGEWLPAPGMVFCCERASAQRVNERSDSHCDHAPAIEFRDGTKIWALDGILVDQQLVMRPQAQALGRIRNERNAELKRIRIERYAGKDRPPAEGWRRYLQKIGAECIERRRNDVENTDEALMRTSEGETILVCACPSTARIYALEVDPACQNIDQAQAYLHSDSKLDGTPPNVIGRS